MRWLTVDLPLATGDESMIKSRSPPAVDDSASRKTRVMDACGTTIEEDLPTRTVAASQIWILNLPRGIRKEVSVDISASVGPGSSVGAAAGAGAPGVVIGVVAVFVPNAAASCVSSSATRFLRVAHSARSATTSDSSAMLKKGWW